MAAKKKTAASASRKKATAKATRESAMRALAPPVAALRKLRAHLQTSELVAALENAWREIQGEHTDTPDAVIVIASGSMSRGAMKWGHFAPDRWSDGRAKKKAIKGKGKPAAPMVHEVLISGEGLARGGKATLVTLLHEGAHGIARARGVSDTSRGGRYHNKRFAALGEELGLVVKEQGSRGWAHTEMSAAGAKRWGKLIKALDKAIAKSFRIGEGSGKAKAEPTRMLKAQCECATPRVIRVARKTFELAAITCGECECDFALEGGE